ncbi:MAG: accessory factor UbiK family protein [Pseudomonadota bacterium]
MTSQNRIFEDLSRLAQNAAGVAQGAREEMETAMQSWFDRFLADRNLVTREEFDAVREMATLARDENETLKARIADLEAKLGQGGAD